jgi:hypothetical protein
MRSPAHRSALATLLLGDQITAHIHHRQHPVDKDCRLVIDLAGRPPVRGRERRILQRLIEQPLLGGARRVDFAAR